MTANQPVTDGTVTLNITLDTVLGSALQYDPETGDSIGEQDVTLGDRVAEILAIRLLADARSDYSQYFRKAAAAADAAAERLVEEKFRDVLQREIVPTDVYGTPKGPGKTIAEVLDDKVEAWLKAGHGDSYSGRRQSNLTKLIDDAIGRYFASEIQKTVEAAKVEALRTVAAQVTAGVAEAMKRAAR